MRVSSSSLTARFGSMAKSLHYTQRRAASRDCEGAVPRRRTKPSGHGTRDSVRPGTNYRPWGRQIRVVLTPWDRTGTGIPLNPVDNKRRTFWQQDYSKVLVRRNDGCQSAKSLDRVYLRLRFPSPSFGLAWSASG